MKNQILSAVLCLVSVGANPLVYDLLRDQEEKKVIKAVYRIPSISKASGITIGKSEQLGKKKVKIPKRVVLMFSAAWCSPCQDWKRENLESLKKSVRVGNTKHDQFRVVRLDHHPGLRDKWKVTKIPSFIFLDNVNEFDGTIVKRMTGSVPLEEINQFLN